MSGIIYLVRNGNAYFRQDSDEDEARFYVLEPHRAKIFTSDKDAHMNCADGDQVVAFEITLEEQVI